MTIRLPGRYGSITGAEMRDAEKHPDHGRRKDQGQALTASEGPNGFGRPSAR